MELNMDLDAETFKKFQKFLAMKETIDKYKRIFVNINYKSKETAQKAGMNFMRYRKEKPYIKGNKILSR